MRKLFLLLALAGLMACQNRPQHSTLSVEETRDGVIERLVAGVAPEELPNIDNNYVLNALTEAEKEVFATKHWHFTVDKPVIVSVMRSVKQAIVPFWLTEKGFTKTDKMVKNQNFTYEVWQKEFPAGEVGLGINGFDLERVVYFVAVGPKVKGETVAISHLSPNRFPVIKMEKGAYMYNDWTELAIEEFPQELEGHTLFTTIRGRAREAAIVGAFRKTEIPATKTPDQIVLTWSEDPKTTQTIQWRTDTSVEASSLYYYEKGARVKSSEVAAKAVTLKDVYIWNNMSVKHWEATIQGLKPNTVYNYYIDNATDSILTGEMSFKTAPEASAPFRFIYLGDTHNSENIRTVGEMAMNEAPDAAFITVAGDNVGMGQFRNLWDAYFDYGKNIFSRIPLMPVLGNHDSQDGVFPSLYLNLFALPNDSCCGLTPERNYTFAYANARFFMLDATGDNEAIAHWLDNRLAQTTEAWKIVVVHFPPYCEEDSYEEVRQSLCKVYDQYHVDLVLTGHVHQYMRSYPIKKSNPVKQPAEGTIYITSVTVDAKDREPAAERYNPVTFFEGGLYQIISIDNNRLDYIARHRSGKEVDKFSITK